MTPEIVQMIWEKGGVLGIGLLILFKIGEWVFTAFRAKQKLTDEGIKTLKDSLDKNTAAQAVMQEDNRKMKIELRKVYFALKATAGASWAKIADDMKEEFKDL